MQKPVPVEKVEVGDFVVGVGRVQSVHCFETLHAHRESDKPGVFNRSNALQYAKFVAKTENDSYRLRPDSLVFEFAGRKLAFKIGLGHLLNVCVVVEQEYEMRKAA